MPILVLQPAQAPEVDAAILTDRRLQRSAGKVLNPENLLSIDDAVAFDDKLTAARNGKQLDPAKIVIGAKTTDDIRFAHGAPPTPGQKR